MIWWTILLPGLVKPFLDLQVGGESKCMIVILLHWRLSSNLHIANNKIIDTIVDHKHFTSFPMGFYSIFTTIRYLRCKGFFSIWIFLYILYDIGKRYSKLNLLYSIEDFWSNPNSIHIFSKSESFLKMSPRFFFNKINSCWLVIGNGKAWMYITEGWKEENKMFGLLSNQTVLVLSLCF